MERGVGKWERENLGMFEPAINNLDHSHLSPCLQMPKGLFQDPVALGAYDGCISWNHPRTMEWPGLKRTPKIIWFQPPCRGQGGQPLDQAAQSHIQPGLQCLRGWGVHSLSGQVVPVRHHLLSEKLPPHV
ncbi:Uncharacterised protein [Chlamydia abortus]|nr:Uncharacterised protein [Chlamydia abortus]